MATQPSRPSLALLHALNAVPSVLWSGLALGPLSVFCYQHVARPWLWGMVAGSLLAYAVPTAWFRYWQLSSSLQLYQRLGVPAINQLTQNGGLVHRLVRRHYPQYRRVRGRAGLRGLVTGSYHQERFHVGMLLLFAGVSGYAWWQGYPGWALLLSISNVGYNLYPIWLQQYVRLRLPGRGYEPPRPDKRQP